MKIGEKILTFLAFISIGSLIASFVTLIVNSDIGFWVLIASLISLLIFYIVLSINLYLDKKKGYW